MANEYLQRTPTSTGNRKVWTWSGWVKKGTSGVANPTLFSAGNNNFVIRMDDNSSSDKIELYHYNGSTYDYRYITNLRNRDVSSWLNIVLISDTTASTSSDRIKIYINGYLVTDFGTRTDPSINFLSYVSNVNIHSIGANNAGGSPLGYYNGYISDQFFIDGQALTPDVFGFYKVGKGYISVGSSQATDFRPGQWVPKTPRVIKTAINNNGGFGVNGFYLPMNDSNNFGADFHGTPNSIIKLQENLPQPRCRIDGVGDYTGALRDDPFKQYLVLALPFVSGGLQSGFGDYSAAIKGSGTPKSFTANGNVAIANTAGYYGSSSYFDGNGDYLRTSTNISDFQFGTGDFTIETWLWKSANGVNGYDGVATLGTSGSAGDGWFLEASATRGYYLVVGGGGIVQYNVSANTSQWNHLAICRRGIITTMYLNGVAVGINTNSSYTVPATATTLDVGGYAVGAGNYWFNGYLQDLRIYKGVAKYTGGFDVPRPYTPVGIATWRAVPDTTANNFATLNPLVPSVFSSGDRSISNGNLTVTTITTGNGTNARSTIGVSTGRWYAETYLSGDTNGAGSFLAVFGIGRTDNQTNASSGDHINYYGSNGNKYDYDNGSPTISSYGSTYTTGDIIGISINGDNGEVVFYKNGVSQGVAKTFTTSQYPLFFQMEDGASAATVTYNMNFGQNPTFSGNTTAGTFTDSNGKGLFKYQPPSGFLALCEDNLPTPAIANPGRHFKTVLYTGDGASGRSITGIGFTPDLVWTKYRNVVNNHHIFDSLRGPFLSLKSNTTDADQLLNTTLLSVNSDGFSLGSSGDVNASGGTYVAWCWKAGAGTTSTNTNGSITSVVSVNQDAGFSIVSYTGTGANATVGHGLGKVPKMVIIKQRSLSGYSWVVYHSGLTNANYYVALESTIGQTSVPALFNSTAPTSSVFSVGTETAVSGNGNTFIAYCWAEIEGFSKFGSYVGNNSTDGPFCYCGFRPAWVMIKSSSASVGNWLIMDNARNSTNPVDLDLYANLTNIESQYARFDYISNGFKVRNTSSEMNGSGVTYIFVAFAESPFQTANAK